jgi:hypothetical protein
MPSMDLHDFTAAARADLNLIRSGPIVSVETVEVHAGLDTDSIGNAVRLHLAEGRLRYYRILDDRRRRGCDGKPTVASRVVKKCY